MKKRLKGTAFRPSINITIIVALATGGRDLHILGCARNDKGDGAFDPFYSTAIQRP
jgi:hypothetical protein